MEIETLLLQDVEGGNVEGGNGALNGCLHGVRPLLLLLDGYCAASAAASAPVVRAAVPAVLLVQEICMLLASAVQLAADACVAGEAGVGLPSVSPLLLLLTDALLVLRALGRAQQTLLSSPHALAALTRYEVGCSELESAVACCEGIGAVRTKLSLQMSSWPQQQHQSQQEQQHHHLMLTTCAHLNERVDSALGGLLLAALQAAVPILRPQQQPQQQPISDRHVRSCFDLAAKCCRHTPSLFVGGGHAGGVVLLAKLLRGSIEALRTQERDAGRSVLFFVECISEVFQAAEHQSQSQQLPGQWWQQQHAELALLLLRHLETACDGGRDDRGTSTEHGGSATLGAALVLQLLQALCGVMPHWQLDCIMASLRSLRRCFGCARFGQWLRGALFSGIAGAGFPRPKVTQKAKEKFCDELMGSTTESQLFKKLLKTFCGGKKKGS
jgi:hypothetical protein